MSQDALRKCRHNLLDLNLIEEVTEEGPRPRTYLVITDKGRRVVQKIREIKEIIEESWIPRLRSGLRFTDEPSLSPQESRSDSKGKGGWQGPTEILGGRGDFRS